MRCFPTALIVVLFFASCSAFGAVDSSYEAITLGEIENIRKIKLAEKQIEVLARMERMSAPQVENNSYSSSSSRSKSSSKSEQSTEVS